MVAKTAGWVGSPEPACSQGVATIAAREQFTVAWSPSGRDVTIGDMKGFGLKAWLKGSGPLAWLFYVVIRAVFSVMQAFPIDWNLYTARLIAHIWIWIQPRHHNLAMAHLAGSLGKTHTPAEIREIATRSLESTVMFAVEVICLPRLVNRFTWSRYVRMVDFHELLGLIVEGRGLILVTGHYGSFELIGHLLRCFGFRIAALMRPLDNVHLNRFVVATRRTHGLTLLDKKGAMANAEGLVRDGTLLGFIGDQDAGRKGIFVDFFGRPASTYKSIGLLAMSTSRPIAVGYVRRRGNEAKYDIGVQRVIRPEEWERQEDPLRWITETYTGEIEAFVRESLQPRISR